MMLASQMDVAEIQTTQAVQINQHAQEKHAEAPEIIATYNSSGYLCLREYMNNNRIFDRMLVYNQFLEEGMFRTLDGKFVTAFVAPSAHWDKIIARDGYVQTVQQGVCP
jgi:hypothetical protein